MPEDARGMSEEQPLPEEGNGATITVHRPAHWLRPMSPVRVLVDDVEVAFLDVGESISTSVKAGQHTVQARRWTISQRLAFGSPRASVSLADGEELTLVCKPRSLWRSTLDIGLTSWLELEISSTERRS